MITPSLEQINRVKSWTDLFKSLGLNPRNTRVCSKVKDYVREHYPNSHLERYRANAGRFQDSEFAALVTRCQSVAEIIREGGWVAAGGSYAMIWNRIRHLKLPTDHFLGAAHNRGKTFTPKRPIEYYLEKEGPFISSSSLRHRLVKEGLREKECERCHITEWQGEPAPLELDHINGNNRDNRIENLRILCANCHSLTPTHSGKNIKRNVLRSCKFCEKIVTEKRNKTCGDFECVRKQQSATKKTKTNRSNSSCPVCNKNKIDEYKHCSQECASKANQRINWQAIDLREELKTKNFSQLGRELGVSDNAIRKQLKKLK